MQCELCGLPARTRFCCTGCENVYAILLESGAFAQGDFRQTELYRESLRLGLIATAREPADPVPPGAETRESLYHVGGLWCTSCGWLIEHALLREYGVVSAEVVFTSDLLKVRYCPQYIEPGRIPARVERLGYRVSEHSAARESDRHEWRDLTLRLGVAFGLWMNVMLFSLVVYASYFEGIAGWAQRAVPFILMGLTTPAVFWSGAPILRLAARGLVERAIRMDTLVATGVLAAYGYSAAQAFLGGQHFYFDTACAIVTLVLAGKALERAAKEKTAHSVAMLYRLMPKKARVMQDGRERFVAVEALEPGMAVLVRPGERVPADGCVLEGSSPVDESVVTGESAPRLRGVGDDVVGGSLNGAGVLLFRATRAGADSVLAHIVRSVDQAVASRTSLERTVDRVSRIFVPAVLLLAGLTFGACLAAGMGFTEALLRAIAVLVIACPCALGIATPLAITAAVGAASRRGILIRDARVLETFQAVTAVVLDKTGTATEGRFIVRECTIDDPTLAMVAAVESRSEHPLAQAVVRFAEERGLSLPSPSSVEVLAGAGISGVVDGNRIVAGNRTVTARAGRAVAWEQRGLTVSNVSVNGEHVGCLGFGDQLRPHVVEVVRKLREAGARTILLSGDSEATTGQVARRLGCNEYFGGVTPAGKAEAVTRLRKSGQVVAMIGDGINDAPALAAANLGIAMGSGTDLAMQAAPVVLMSDDFRRILEAFQVAKLASGVVRQNLFQAFVYNSAGIALAISGVLNPILAAGAMVVSSLSVIGNSLRLGSIAGRGVSEESCRCEPDTAGPSPLHPVRH